MRSVMSADRVRATVLVEGQVQGVGYRAFARRHALDHGLVGHAENLSDGRVEVVLEGAQPEIEHLLLPLRQGPAHATVSGIEVSWSAVAELAGFHVY
jgi:acylphosphatase